MWYKHRKKRKKFPLNLQLQTIQILTNDVQMLILCLSYSITSVPTYVTYLFEPNRGAVMQRPHTNNATTWTV